MELKTLAMDDPHLFSYAKPIAKRSEDQVMSGTRNGHQMWNAQKTWDQWGVIYPTMCFFSWGYVVVLIPMNGLMTIPQTLKESLVHSEWTHAMMALYLPVDNPGKVPVDHTGVNLSPRSRNRLTNDHQVPYNKSTGRKFPLFWHQPIEFRFLIPEISSMTCWKITRLLQGFSCNGSGAKWLKCGIWRKSQWEGGQIEAIPAHHVSHGCSTGLIWV